METITLPLLFLNDVGNIALEAQRLVLRIMPFLCILVFMFGFVSFLLGSTKGKLDFTKYVATPIFLLLLVVNYPTVIDVTGKFYGMIIGVFDKPEYKNFYLKYAGVEAELEAYNDKAKTELKKVLEFLKANEHNLSYEQREKFKAAIEHQVEYGWSDKNEEKIKAFEAAKKSVNKEIENAEQYNGNVFSKTVIKLFDFFKLPTVRIIRYILDLVRNLALSFLVMIGCFAIMFECIPAFKGILNKWFKFYTAVTFWALTICVLDAAFLSFAESGVATAKHFLDNANVLNEEEVYKTLKDYFLNKTTTEVTTDFALKWYAYGGSQGLNTAVCVVMVIFYCIVPYLTSLYIGGEQAGMFMSKVVSVGAMATQQLIQTGAGATSALGGAIGAGVGGYKGSVIGQSVGNLMGSVGGMAGVIGAGSGS